MAHPGGREHNNGVETTTVDGGNTITVSELQQYVKKRILSRDYVNVE